MDELTEQLIQRLLAAVARSSDADAQRLLADARAEAEAEVKDLLKSAMKAVLLRQAVTELERAAGVTAPDASAAAGVEPGAPASTPSPTPTPTPAAAPGPVGCYVYGIARAGALELPRGPLGVDGDAAVTAVVEGDLAAVTSAVRLREFEQAAIDEHLKDLAWVEQKVQAHDHVLKAAMGGGAVIPCRFCTIVASENEAKRLLRQHADPIRRTLDRLEGRREWGVKMVYAPDATDAAGDEAGGPDGEAPEGATGKSYLLQKRRQGVRRAESLRAAQAAADECHRLLSDLSVEAALLPVRDRDDAGGKLLLNGAYLVGDSDLDAFDAAVAELQARHRRDRLMLSRTGPWPPYNFARLSLTLEPEPPQRTASRDVAPEAAA